MSRDDLFRNRPGRRLNETEPWKQNKSNVYRLITEDGQFVAIEASSLVLAKTIAAERLHVPYHKIYEMG